ncbi:MAG TPA: hypothetical protein VIR29_06120 [Anseongella sp.]
MLQTFQQVQRSNDLFTRYSYTTTDISQVRQDGITELHSAGSGFHVKVEENTAFLPCVHFDGLMAPWALKQKES